MPITVSGTSITFNDSTTQTTAFTGGGVTSLNGQTGAITNTDFGVIGSYAPAYIDSTNNTMYGPNTTIAGSSLRQRASNGSTAEDFVLSAFDAIQEGVAANPGWAGTWRTMGRSKNQAAGFSGLRGQNIYVRIS